MNEEEELRTNKILTYLTAKYKWDKDRVLQYTVFMIQIINLIRIAIRVALVPLEGAQVHVHSLTTTNIETIHMSILDMNYPVSISKMYLYIYKRVKFKMIILRSGSCVVHFTFIKFNILKSRSR